VAGIRFGFRSSDWQTFVISSELDGNSVQEKHNHKLLIILSICIRIGKKFLKPYDDK